ncbi:hypothetical protein [Campylobacter helveticus]|uniref:Uncharacterized protein n=1 Tax=Campylobacter helveticus TaxID=28898 RepID=A0AAX2UIS6_9BACT|nr:hypothetical protein [Campylobacter helveticus]ELU1350195.1 hypothetical protein [Campylobacter jejuni]ARE81411.1 hypothetical protein CHELV3228_a0036 [Campylobacter helveticus]MCR2039829.1 hypothetical protein [Campylobacter helveticus]MCR2060330.1 hypothetical protein [Campylobacter helveticus]MCR2062038.1 hypothetical protein [Campylobacter helveticus]
MCNETNENLEEKDLESKTLNEDSIKEKNLTQELKETKENKETKPSEMKKKSSPRKSESLNFKCEQFFGKNWKFVASFIALALLVMAYEMSNINERMSSLEQIVQENNGKVVLTTSDGRAIKVTKEPLKAEYLKQFALSTYVNNFIVSRSQLTNDFQKVNFKNYDELLANVPNLRVILREFMDSKADESKKIEVNKVAVGDLRAYVQWLIAATAQDKLPEYIAIKDYSVDKYEYSANQFTIELSIKVVAQSYILSRNEYVSQQGIFKIKSKGSFDLSKSSDINPYGMRIESLKIEPIIKTSQGA